MTATTKTPKKKPLLKKRRRQSRKPVIQCHHIVYEPEWTVKVYRGEHMLLTFLQWCKHFSVGFMTALKYFLEVHEKEAVELSTITSLPQ